MSALRVLERYAPRAPRARPDEERGTCDLCGADLPEPHAHVVDLDRRSLHCACGACTILFERPGSGGKRYRAVPTRVLVDPDLRLSEAQWAELGIPVGMAFFLRVSSLDRWAALYPSPAGAVEAEVSLDAWSKMAEQCRLVAAAEPDVEAILIHARRGGPIDCFLVPIDACYELVARVRRSWKGFDGGDQARSEISAFFDGLSARSRPLVASPRGTP